MPRAKSKAKFKPSLTTVCAVSAVGLKVWLTPDGKDVSKRTFTMADLKKAMFSAADRKSAAQSVEWMRQHKIVQSGPAVHALTDKGVRVVQRACTVLARRVRR